LHNNQVLKKYTWGPDLAGSVGQSSALPAALQPAGGIGGLLALEDLQDPNDPNDSLDYVYLYDAAGNVGQLIDWSHDPNDPNAASAAIVARYEYDPYGNVTAAAGPYASANPFRWSTKYWDDETGFGYWGRRYYDAALGRWLSRDPLAELGGDRGQAAGQGEAGQGVPATADCPPGIGPRKEVARGRVEPDVFTGVVYDRMMKLPVERREPGAGLHAPRANQPGSCLGHARPATHNA
jgi:RHS repeat-associated protein